MRRSFYSVTVGDAQDLEIATGEDREIRIAFSEPNNSSNTGYFDFTGGSLYMHVRGLSGLAFNLGGSFVGSGVASWLCFASNTTGIAAQSADVDATYVASDGNRTQVLVRSRFLVSKGLS